MFLKAFFLKVVKSRDCVVKGFNIMSSKHCSEKKVFPSYQNSIDSVQLAQTTQADVARNILISVNVQLIKGTPDDSPAPDNFPHRTISPKQDNYPRSTRLMTTAPSPDQG